MLAKFSAIAIFILVLGSCKKDSGPSITQERFKLLINKKWQLIKLEIDQPADNPNGQPAHMEEVHPFEDSAANDDYEIYFADSTYEWNNNVVLGNNIEQLPGTWHISGDGTKLFRKFDIFPEGSQETFLSLTESQLKLALFTFVNETYHFTETRTYQIME